ncbi:aminoglycoside phosphotransferase family protein [Nocardioides sp.]|uniref:aminoglycoside phosphotransferase family protein n=1 Tax=Nocardioides sp. TaxID=35761 RepID=UPI00286CBB7A|nr:aminoglycoside phosphotransferase family protein [Nocardioides sp.]
MGQTTHDLDLGTDRVTKTFHLRHGDEADREWDALVLLQRHAPGLAPVPLEQRHHEGRPEVVMSRVPGEPLGSVPLGDAQLDALAGVLHRLHAAVPTDELARLPLRRADQAGFVAEMRVWVVEEHATVSAVVEQALAAALAWLSGPEAGALAQGPVDRVFTHGDGNIANLLWDGATCRVVDFEDAGVSDPAYEVADLLEHVSVWLRGIVRPEDLLERLGLSDAQSRRVLSARRLFATFWLLMLLPGGPADARNPPGSLERQALRVLDLLRST